MTRVIPPQIQMTTKDETVSSPPQYRAPAPTKEPLEYADLAIIDLSKANTPEARAKLATEVTQAMKTHGFFYVINHGYTADQTNDIFSIANLTFDVVSQSEKALYMSKSNEIYEGYKPRRTWLIDGEVQDQVEHYNMNRHLYDRAHPQALRPFLPVIEDFALHNHHNIVHPILRLLALGLELPEEALVEKHNFASQGHTSVRFMKYHPRSSEEELKTRNVWLKGHTDFGSITILWSQPVGGLQILSLDGKWRWVRHIDNALVVNAGDALEFLCGGYYPSTRHRVVQPPADQRDIPRLGVFYFVMPNDDTALAPFEESPVLQREGIARLCNPENAPTMEAWRKGRTASYGKVELKKGAEKGVEEEIVNGVVVKHYN
ncbi:hypothetical protein Hypma_001824 [Hypsizygus marmoreus]|uniref:Fe2OG dioxygenase domain-containing protein n=1 Tax=Hypsizygus marmoreus TaxID=39966 RepID=A0A369J565_HYPMA|nr:hypothetical protein Hypma_001824 [Hypsizygus marmoreus]